jgi:transposase
MKDITNEKKRNPRRRYDEEFKSSVMRMIECGQSVSEISQSLGLGESLLYRWKQELKPAAEREQDEEKAALLRRIKQLELERDILKKALGIFSRGT